MPVSEILSGAEDVTPDWLTNALQGCGALSSGRVTSVESGDVTPQPVSLTTRLRIHYSADLSVVPWNC